VEAWKKKSGLSEKGRLVRRKKQREKKASGVRYKERAVVGVRQLQTVAF
jgi:hypothetical protein